MSDNIRVMAEIMAPNGSGRELFEALEEWADDRGYELIRTGERPWTAPTDAALFDRMEKRLDAIAEARNCLRRHMGVGGEDLADDEVMVAFARQVLAALGESRSPEA